jgi:glycerol-3-phosphate dehydrogenase
VLRDPLTPSDIVGTWAGLRPLLKGGRVGEKTADLSRRHALRTSDSGVISITGGKLTTYRRMAADAVDAITEDLGRGGSSRTKRLPLIGAEGSAPADEHLARRYGSLAADVLALIEADASLGELLVPGLSYRKAEAIYAARHEMATTVDDVLSRRTRARLLASEASATAADTVARLLAPELGWDEAEIVRQIDAYRTAVVEERAAAGLTATSGSDSALDAALGS